MSVINTGSVAKALQVGVNKFWGMGYDEKTPLQLTDAFDTEQSEKAYEEDVQLVGTGLFPIKAETAAVQYDAIRQGFVKRYNHLTYALGVIFSYEMLKDGQYELGFKRAKYLGFSARQTQEIIAANVLNRAFNSSYTGADGKELCATDHPNVSGGTFRNELSVAADLSQAALEQALIDIDSMTDDRGLRIALKAKKLIVPAALRFEAARILKSDKEAGTANNDLNAVRTETGLGFVVNNYLDDADAWFIKTSAMDGLKRYVREAASAPVQENDFDTRNLKFATFFRESYGWTDPRGVFASPGG
jgi:hypothetical protein